MLAAVGVNTLTPEREQAVSTRMRERLKLIGGAAASALRGIQRMERHARSESEIPTSLAMACLRSDRSRRLQFRPLGWKV
jgi:hypothetical protein